MNPAQRLTEGEIAATQANSEQFGVDHPASQAGV
jgi:hypothetical protein